MVERILGPVLGHRLLFVALFVVLLFLRLLPMPSTAGDWPGPDILLCLVFAWTLRRPDYLPFWLVALVVLAEDLVLMRPPGLWAALVVAGSEFFRARAGLARELAFGMEWLLVAAIMVALFVTYYLVQSLVLVAQAPFGFTLIQLIASVVFYPAAVVLSRLGFGLRKPATGEVDARGRRL